MQDIENKTKITLPIVKWLENPFFDTTHTINLKHVYEPIKQYSTKIDNTHKQKPSIMECVRKWFKR